jgi:hypothetical protein
MRFIATLSLLLLAIGAVGCSRSAAPRSVPVSVTGKVTRAGQTVGDVVVTFQPMDVGHPGMFPLKADGTFQGDLIAGNYMYYVAKGATPTSTAALAKIDPKFHEPSMDRSIAVEPGQELILALD